jgi:2-polyprenyl-6-methoxyphenol hydroxylase-like FAD-dependent oxidoreductase
MVTDQGTFTLGDFTQLPGKFQSLSMVPQWDFLDFITTEAEKYPTFRLQFRTRVVGLIEEDGVVRGVRYRTHDGEEGESGRSSPSPRTAATPPSGAPRASPRWSTAHPSTSSGTECRRAPKTPTVRSLAFSEAGSCR